MTEDFEEHSLEEPGEIPPDWAEGLAYIERLHKQFHSAKDKGEVTFCALSTLNLSFILTTVLNTNFPSDSNTQEYYPIPVPLWALQHLVNAVGDYMAADHGKTFGEILGIEGGGQGRQKTKDRLATRMANRELALWVEILRTHLHAEGKKEEAKLVNVFAAVAERTGYSPLSVEKAYKKYRRTLSSKEESRG